MTLCRLISFSLRVNDLDDRDMKGIQIKFEGHWWCDALCSSIITQTIT